MVRVTVEMSPKFAKVLEEMARYWGIEPAKFMGDTLEHSALEFLCDKEDLGNMIQKHLRSKYNIPESAKSPSEVA